MKHRFLVCAFFVFMQENRFSIFLITITACWNSFFSDFYNLLDILKKKVCAGICSFVLFSCMSSENGIPQL